MKKNEAIRKAKNFDELLNIQYGKIGTKKRDEFEGRAQAACCVFAICQMTIYFFVAPSIH